MYFDAHTHVHFDDFGDEGTDAVIKRALSANVWLVNVGANLTTSQGAVTTAHQYPEGVYAAVGLHPTDTQKETFDPAAYRALAEDPKTVAIGECGLDYFRLDRTDEAAVTATKQRQREALLAQIALAREVGKPLMIHCREAFDDLIALLRDHRADLLGTDPGLIHFFTGTVANMKDLLDLGFSFTFGGVVTFTRDYDEVVRYAPLDRLLSETDAPYVAPVPYRGKRNEPAYVIETVKKLAELRGITPEAMGTATFENAKRMFRIS